MTATVVIASHNRREELRNTCSMLRTINPGPDRVIVMLDASDDGSLEMLNAEFPAIEVVVSVKKVGSIKLRDEGFTMVTTDLIVSLDDDSYPLDSDFLSRVALAAAKHPEAAVLAAVELRPGDQTVDPSMSPDSNGHYVPWYTGCGAVIRRSLYGAIGRYNSLLGHTYEESDFSIQCYGNGYGVWFEPTLRVRHHYAQALRSHERINSLQIRNELLSTIQWCPAPQLIVVAAYKMMSHARHAILRFGVWKGLVGVMRSWLSGVGLASAVIRARRPLRWDIYWAWLRLKKEPIYSTAEFAMRFRPAAASLRRGDR